MDSHDAERIEDTEKYIAEYLALKAQLHIDSKRYQELRGWLKSQPKSFATDKYVVAFEDRKRQGFMSVDRAIKEGKVPFDTLAMLIITSEYRLVHVAEKKVEDSNEKPDKSE